MAEWENRLGQESPLSRALRMAPEDFRNPLLHPEAVNHFALPPQQPRAELRNPAPRPGDYLSPVSEALSPTMGAYGLGNALGDAYVQGREGNYRGMASPLAEILLSMAPVPGMKKGAMPPRVENPIKAYHGSPHDFDKFDLSKIGTGEGAQAYGHGLYFAESEPVAKSYRDKLTDGASFIRPDGTHWDPGSLSHVNVRVIARRHGIDAAIDAARKLAVPPWTEATVLAGKDLKALEKLQASGGVKPNPGHMYEVGIHASPDQFLDWDKPLSQQSEAVRTAMASALEKAGVKPDAYRMPVNYPDGRKEFIEPASRALEELSAAYDGHRGASMPGHLGQASARASQELNQAGIPGIRYLDQGSRGAGQGTSNFVVFDENLIEILRKYGLLGPVAAGATANALMGDKDSQ